MIIEELRRKYRLQDIPAFDGMPHSTFYHQLKHLHDEDKHMHIEEKEVITQIFRENQGRYGYRRITMEMHNRVYCINHKTVRKLMHSCGVKCEIRSHKYRSYKDSVGKVTPNLLNRNFVATKPNQKWVTDVTEFNVRGEKVYLLSILDLFNGEIVSYNILLHPIFHQLMDMLDKDFKKIPNTSKIILHSDQGWQYQMKKYQL